MPNIELDATKIEKSSKTLGEFAKALESEIKDIDEVIVPLLRVYLNDIRDTRMALAREVKDIALSSQELTKALKIHDEVLRFCSAIEVMKRVLTPEVIELMKKITRE